MQLRREVDETWKAAMCSCLFGPVLLTGLYCVVAHVVSPRLTHAAAHTQSPLVARLAGNTLRCAEGVANGAVRLADTWPTA